MSTSIKDSAVHGEGTLEIAMEEEEDLFEIDLEAVNALPPPHYWESYYSCSGSGNGNALLANCLLPISDISVAVPACSSVYLAAAPTTKGNASTILLLVSASVMMMSQSAISISFFLSLFDFVVLLSYHQNKTCPFSVESPDAVGSLASSSSGFPLGIEIDGSDREAKVVLSSKIASNEVIPAGRVKKDLISGPAISTLGLAVTAEGKNSWPLNTCLLLLNVTDIFTVGVNESRTSPITLPTIRGSVDVLIAITYI
ncbi:uncharacterized protein G2W53_024237 [Senna tora]|uniref:Uncharacterized protein n=1 Tax=Senna tora TaxID=362788 RepID=A0A834WDQ7_9FABA|nr:uncharacterized protein G2W53_024237 [Senna tora]